MKISLHNLKLTCQESIENLKFGQSVTFIHGPVSTGKSTVARLVDYCLGGSLVKTTAIQKELLAVELDATVGEYDVHLSLIHISEPRDQRGSRMPSSA